MSSKADYLKKYLSAGDSIEDKKKKKRIKKRANIAIHDDDVDWRSLVPKKKQDIEEEGDPDEAPLVAEFKDESVSADRKWQPLNSKEEKSPLGRDSKSPDQSPARRKRHDSDDISPPRKRKNTSRTGQSASDLSPVRNRKSHYDQSSPRRSRVRQASPEKLESGMSNSKSQKQRDVPPRTRHDSGDVSPPRRTRHDSGDISPPRRTRHDSGDISPPRRTRHDSGDNSPPRKNRRTSDDMSPPRRAGRTQLSPDLSPPRKGAATKGQRMSSGAKSGLQNAQALKKENALVRKRQEDYFKGLDPSMSGKHAETVYRDKQGRKVDPKLEKLLRKEKEKAMEEENEKFMRWGKGDAQSKSYEEKLQDDVYEMSKPLARYADDEDLEKMLKEKERAGDPMLAFIKRSNSGNSSKKSVKKVRPTYKGSFPLNRYGARPGYRWDGVNRSNGFEKSWFARESNKKAVADEAYKWSVEDM